MKIVSIKAKYHFQPLLERCRMMNEANVTGFLYLKNITILALNMSVATKEIRRTSLCIGMS